LNDKKKDSQSYDPHPIIMGTEEKVIPEQKPPNHKIIYYNLAKKKDDF